MTTTVIQPVHQRPGDMILNGKRDAIAAALPSMVDKARFIQIAASVANTKEIVDCSPASVMNCIFGCAKLGLIPDPVLGHVYLVPYKNTATLIPGYRGYIELARRSGKVGAIETDLVYVDDQWEYWKDERGPHFRHVPNLDSPNRTKDHIRCVYCVCENLNGHPTVEVMTKKAIDAIPGKGPVWKQHYEEMARKTVVRRASKYWSLSPELAQAVDWDERAERGEHQDLPEVNGEHALPDGPRRLSLADDDPKPEGTDAAMPTENIEPEEVGSQIGDDIQY